MSYSITLKENAAKFRQEGHTIKEISIKLNIAKSTASGWLNTLILNKQAQQKLQKRKLFNYYKISQRWLQKRLIEKEKAQNKARNASRNLILSKNHLKFLCSFLFWAEGAKDLGSVKFINSDPKMIKTFLFLLRHSFPINEKKFRALIHIHEYHNEKQLKVFWSKITNIPIKQFYKSYLKPHTKKRKRLNYQGSINISYYDAKLARELCAIYNTLTDKLLGV
ncbi:MAG: hypothetical protein AAB430_02705 [Patescibacteria group bacterium]